ncbi:hypothetical protein PsorP6_008574 [Peronosclerospora sorghi]|uniref:Uncharacterized protein n=1 Tax=Peronosclerospora sorghi TaxID=230839 RepID=A0ACC0W7R2_9STRA|nr:hypothetical protein PsorP6_008574 [Peronosclerospora sorghi]
MDQYPEPISPGMKETEASRNDAEAIEKRTKGPSDEAEEHFIVDEANVVAASPRAEAHMEAGQANQTQPCPSSCVDLAPPWEMGMIPTKY